ncbi:MAG TPA: zinc-binding alcohol dehydrogenase family protein [Chitinophagaceae bacterium]|nr:zinc-binding alcohol dehydrogenase family protein [Chitinophagaceae bacterium]
MMRSLVCAAPGQFEYEDIERPLRKEGYSTIRIKRIGICGTDLHAYQGNQPFFHYPRILGHELAGEFAEGDAEGFVKGELVTIMPYFYCGNCIACKKGKPNCCASLSVCGVHQHGGMVEFLSVPSYSLLHGDGLGLDELALVEPLAIGAHGVRRAGVTPGEFVAVIGTGPIGLGIIEFARIAGAKLIAIDVNGDRLQFCVDKLGVEFTINPGTEDVMGRLAEITGNDMPSVVIDATGSLKAINDAFRFMAHGGRYVLVGLQKEAISFSHPEFHKREATLMSSRNATKEDFMHVIRSMKKGLIKPATYITHRVQFNEVKDQFQTWLNPSNGVLKAIIEL